MIRFVGISVLLASVLMGTASLAEIRELDQREVRAIVANGQALGLGPILQNVARKTEGEAVDVRVFDDGGLIYSILVMLPNGTMGTVFVDGNTGEVLSPMASRIKAVQEVAKQSPGQNKSNNGAASKSQGKSGNAGSNGKNSDKGKSSDKSKGKK